MIAYPIWICLSGWKTLTKASKPCYSPRSAALQWCVRTLLPWIPKELSSISNCFGDQKAIKTPKLNTISLELIARVLNMLIGLKGDNYYSKVFKRVKYKLSNSTFWLVITDVHLKKYLVDRFLEFKMINSKIVMSKNYELSCMRYMQKRWW